MIAADDDISNNSENNQEKRTVGEELFLVHLSRASAAEPDPSDFDRETKKKGACASSSLPAAAAAATTAKTTKQKGGKASSSSSSGEDSPTPGEELWKVHCKRFKGSGDGLEVEDDEEADRNREGVKGRRGLIGAGGAAAQDDGRVLHLRSRDVAIH